MATDGSELLGESTCTSKARQMRDKPAKLEDREKHDRMDQHMEGA